MERDSRRPRDRSGTNLLCLWNRSCVVENAFSLVCVVYRHLDHSRISLSLVLNDHHIATNCARQRNYQVQEDRHRLYPGHQYWSHCSVRVGFLPLFPFFFEGSVDQLIFEVDSSTGARLPTFRYRCSAPTYSRTLRSSARVLLLRVFDNRRLWSVLATAAAGLCSRLYSLSNSSTKTSFLADCISSVEVDYRGLIALVAVKHSESHLSAESCVSFAAMFSF